MLTPVLATALLSLTSMDAVLLFDMLTFFIAFVALLFFVRIPRVATGQTEAAGESVLQSAKSGLRYLKRNRGILDLILLLAVINFTASIFNAALPTMILSRTGGGELALGMVNSLLFSMRTENFILAFGRSTPIWCVGALLGWIFIPAMNANMDVLFRTKIPVELQGRAYSAGNSLQFFTIPLGYICGGFLIDRVFEPFMAAQPMDGLWAMFFGSGKGSGAALLFLVIGVLGALSCLPFRADKHIWRLEQ